MMRKLLALGALLFGGCLNPQDSTGVGNPGLTQTEQALYDDGDEGRKGGDVASAIVAIPHLALTAPADIDTQDKAAALGEFGKLAFTPDGCVTSMRALNVVTFDFKDCTYKLGYGHVSGRLEATYVRDTTGAVTIAVKTIGPAFTLETFNKRLEPITITITITGTATVQFAGGTKRVSWVGQSSGTGPLGTMNQESSYDTSVAASCLDVDGVTKTQFPGGRGVETSIVGYRRCGPKTACPLAGKVTSTALLDKTKTITIEFLGGRNVRVTVPGRPAFETDKLLQCSG
jgi:hypothetical protein